MHETEVEERVADAAAEGGDEKRAYVRAVFEQVDGHVRPTDDIWISARERSTWARS